MHSNGPTLISKINNLIISLEKSFSITGSIRETALSLKKEKNSSKEKSLQLEEIQSLSEEIYKFTKSNTELLKSQIKALNELDKSDKKPIVKKL